jgi:adenine-specific DNA-methyltransferase
LCDPAVGSGHFLVSALNELIAIKSELRILQDRQGKRLKEYTVQVENDELVVTDDDGQLFEYNPLSRESQRVQETLFHEKQTIIENCLFGVDINPNSVKICRLRLWIELLKNAYYRVSPVETWHAASLQRELETLPNIDINIKCGNSLISRFALDADIKQALKTSIYTITSYRSAVDLYRNAENKEQKREMEKLIAFIKSDFKSNIDHPFKKTISAARGKVDILATQINTSKQWGEKVDKKAITEFEKAVAKLKKLEDERDDIEANKIYENAFEWRFEFPEVLNDEGDFIGFDVVIGNPPYIRVQELPYQEIDYYKKSYSVGLKRIDISILFIELSKVISKNNGFTVYITSNQFLTTEYGEAARNFLLNHYQLLKVIDFGDAPVFDEALTYVSIFIFRNSMPQDFKYSFIDKSNLLSFNDTAIFDLIKIQNLSSDSWILKNVKGIDLIQKLETFPKLKSIGNCWAGLFTGLDKILMFDSKEITRIDIEPDLLLPIIRAQDCDKYNCKIPSKYVIYPYKVDEGKTVLLSENELKMQFPKGYDYLVKNKGLLSDRMDSRKILNDVNSWFKLTRFGQKQIFQRAKIVSPGEVKNHKFCVDNSKAGFSCARVFAITIDKASFNIYSILALLNSSLFKYYLQSKASLKAGGYYSYSSKVLNNAPIPNAKNLEESKLSLLALNIENIKKQDPTADTTAIESEIDQLVYKLYVLTEDEIKIVEGEK